jgi:hypothetical protein
MSDTANCLPEVSLFGAASEVTTQDAEGHHDDAAHAFGASLTPPLELGVHACPAARQAFFGSQTALHEV